MKQRIIACLACFIMLLTGCDETETHGSAPVVTTPVGTLIVSYSFPAFPLDGSVRAGELSPFAEVTLTASGGDVPVTGVVIKRGSDAIASATLLNEGGLALGAPQPFDTLTDEATIGGAFVVRNGTSVTLSIAGIMASDLSTYVGGFAYIDILDIDAPSISVSLPIAGRMLVMRGDEACSDTAPVNPVLPGISNRILGRYTVQNTGTSSVQTHVFHVDVSGTSGTPLPLTNLSLYNSSGAIVAGPVDAVAVNATTQVVTFNDTVLYQDGSEDFTIHGSIPGTIPYGTVFSIHTNPALDWAGVTGNTPVVSPTEALSMTATAASAKLIVETSPLSPADYFDVLAGVTDQHVSVVRITALDGDVRLGSVPLAVTGSTSISQVTLWDGGTQIGTAAIFPGQNTATAVLPEQVLIASGTSKDIEIRADFQGIGPGYPGTEGALVVVDAMSTHMGAVSVETGWSVPACGKSATFGVHTVSAIASP